MKSKALFFNSLISSVLMCTVFLSGCGAEPAEIQQTDKERFTKTYLDVFDTVTTVIGYAESSEEFENQVSLLYEDLKYYHKLFDIYNSYTGINNLKTVNDNAGLSPVECDPEIISLLTLCKDLYAKTSGMTNVAMGSVLSVWHSYREQGLADPENAKLPPYEELSSSAAHTNIENVTLDSELNTVFLKDPEMSLDVGAVAKGYAAQKAADSAANRGFENFLLSVGGNVCTVGFKGDGTSLWSVGIENPFEDSRDRNLFVTEISGLSVVTSGDYQRYYEVDSKRYCHIISPLTLMPNEEFKSVTVIGTDSGICDGLSTALFNMSYDEGKDLIDNTKGYDAIWVYPDGEVKYTPGFQRLIKK